MNIDVLKTYKIVVERGSLTAASRELGLSQPAVSMQIASLEDYFGARLLYRTARGVAMTQAGRHVLDLANNFEQSVLKARNSLTEASNELEGELKIAASNTPGTYVLPKLVSEFRSKNPKVKVTLEIRNSRQAIDTLLSEEVQIAATGDYIDNDRVDVHPLIKDTIILIAPHDYETDSINTVDDLITNRTPLLSRLSGSATMQNVSKFLKVNEFSIQEFNIVSKYNSVITQINAVSAGVGLAFVSQLAAERALKLQEVKQVNIEGLPLERQLYLIIKKTGEQSRVASSFWDMILGK